MSQQQPMRSFKDLKLAFGSLHLEVKKIDQDILKDPSRFDEVVEQKVAGVNQIQKGIQEALDWLVASSAWLASCQNDPMRLRIARKEIAPQEKEIRDWIADCLNSEEPIYKTAAATAYLNFQFGQEFADYQQAADMLADLEQRKLLVKAGNDGAIMIGYQRYDVSNEFGLEPEDLVQVKTAVAKFSREYMQLVKWRRQERADSLAQMSTLVIADFLAGKRGKFFLQVPAENLGPDPETGNDRWRGGGGLLLEVSGEQVKPLEGVGAIENHVKNMVEMGVQLPHHTLNWKFPPGIGKSFDKVCREIMENRECGQEDAEAYLKKMQSFWHLIARGVDDLTQKEELAKLREDYAKKADINPDQFFGLKGGAALDGSVYLEFEGAFKDKKAGQLVHNIFFLAKRSREEGSDPVLEMLDAPAHVRELLGAGCFGQKLKEGENFSALPPTLQRILRAIRGKTDLSAEIAKDA